MSVVTTIYSRVVASGPRQRGQTMTEYVLIITAVAVASYVAYQGYETGINGIISNVTTALSAA